MLQGFGLTKEDFMETMAEFQFEPVHRHAKGAGDKYKSVDTATKSVPVDCGGIALLLCCQERLVADVQTTIVSNCSETISSSTSRRR